MNASKITKQVNAYQRLPRADTNLLSTAKQAAAKWADNDWLTFKWISQAEFQQTVDSFNTQLSQKQLIASTRPAVTAALRQVGLEMNAGVRFIKVYLFEKYGDAAQDHYGAFGLMPISESMRLPRDREERAEALKVLLRAIEEEGFTEKPYGKVYWTELIENYNALLQKAKNIDSTVSLKVGIKNQHRNTIVRGLDSIIFALKAHFPDTYKAEMRSWGFQKEKY